MIGGIHNIGDLSVLVQDTDLLILAFIGEVRNFSTKDEIPGFLFRNSILFPQPQNMLLEGGLSYFRLF